MYNDMGNAGRQHYEDLLKKAEEYRRFKSLGGQETQPVTAQIGAVLQTVGTRLAVLGEGMKNPQVAPQPRAR